MLNPRRLCSPWVVARVRVDPPREVAADRGEEWTMSNGMKWLLMSATMPHHRHRLVVMSISANECRGSPASPTFEHMMFKAPTDPTHQMTSPLIWSSSRSRSRSARDAKGDVGHARKGETSSMDDPNAKTARKELDAKFDELVAKQRDNIIKGSDGPDSHQERRRIPERHHQ